MAKSLILEFTYEDLIRAVDNKLNRITELIVPVEEFEIQINLILSDIRRSGYLLLFHGVTGSGKSTFLSSLRWRSHIPIKHIENVDASGFNDPQNPRNKLGRLYAHLKSRLEALSHQISMRPDVKICIVIDYLENLQNEDENDIRAFFRDLNALLRQNPILIVWPLTTRQDVESTQRSASDYSSTIFHRRLPVMWFTGPPMDTYADIAKKSIALLNEGKNFYDFQLNDQDFGVALEIVKNKPPEQRTIREYLQVIRSTWEDRIDYVSRVRSTVPYPTEVWFVICYPEAEKIVAQFSGRASVSAQDAWNADYSKLSEYARDNQRAADWPQQPTDRLALALTGVLTTKIMFLPTNALVNCVAAYREEAGVPITHDEFVNLDVPTEWFHKSKARLALLTTPVYLQLMNQLPRKGNRRGGTVARALDVARKPFERINELASGKSEGGSDRPFNRAIAEALKTCFDAGSGFTIQAEQRHPYLRVTPDILVTSPDKRNICLEFHYTVNTQPNRLAAYCLSKLNTYMSQIEALNSSDQPYLPL